MSHPTGWLTLKAVISMTTPLKMCACILTFSLNVHPSPRWNVTRAHGWQGGGLYIAGTAMLTNTNVYANQADEVCSPFEISLKFHPSPHTGMLTCAMCVVAVGELS